MACFISISPAMLPLIFFLSSISLACSAQSGYPCMHPDANILSLSLRVDEPFIPLIGIFSQPGDGDGGKLIRENGWTNASYIAASYVKFVEAGGARAVPLIYNEPDDVLRKKFAVINGILFPGGAASLKDGPFYQTAAKLFKMALEENDKGNHFPVFGTCLGFELISIIVSQDHEVLENVSALALPSPLHFTNDEAKQKSMFKWFSRELVEDVSNKPITMQNHMYGLSPEKWQNIEELVTFFEVLTTSLDKKNKVYVSTVQGRKYPVTGVQWHPEKNSFESGIANIPHSAEAVQVTQSAANFLVSEARKSGHRATKEEQQQIIMYNYSPVYSGKDGVGHFDQSYIFV